jgi:L-ascorbate metabolism protein UlaG (beta-lactamase superfamily)
MEDGVTGRRRPAAVIARAGAALGLAWLVGLTGCASTIARPDPGTFRAPRRDAITFWGHACCYIDVGGYGIVTDPVFDSWTWGRTRSIGAPPRAAYARARVILISHAHDDHLSAKTIATFPESTLVLCPVPAARYAAESRRPVRALAIGDVHEFPGGRIRAVAAHHPGARRGVDAEADGRALGYVIETPFGVVYYSGDTDFFPGFADVGMRYAPRITLLNINGHLLGENAVAAARATGAPIIIPMHYGAYGLWSWKGYHRPRTEELLERELGTALRVLDIGGSLPLALAERGARGSPPRTPGRQPGFAASR